MKCSCFHFWHFSFTSHTDARCRCGAYASACDEGRKNYNERETKRKSNKCLFVLEMFVHILLLLLPVLHVIPFHFAPFSWRRVFIRNDNEYPPVFDRAPSHAQVHQLKFHISHSMDLRGKRIHLPKYLEPFGYFFSFFSDLPPLIFEYFLCFCHTEIDFVAKLLHRR